MEKWKGRSGINTCGKEQTDEKRARDSRVRSSEESQQCHSFLFLLQYLYDNVTSWPRYPTVK